MANYVETKENTMSKIKTQMKADVMEYIIQCLIDKYGEENCSYVRNGNGQSKTKEFAVRTSTIEANGEEHEGVVCINAIAKDYREHTSDKGKVFPAYVFNVMREEYEIYVEERNEKKETQRQNKEKKIAKDNATRAKKNEDLMDF